MNVTVKTIEKELKEKGPRYRAARKMHKYLLGKIKLKSMTEKDKEYMRDMLGYFVEKNSDQSLTEFLEQLINR